MPIGGKDWWWWRGLRLFSDCFFFFFFFFFGGGGFFYFIFLLFFFYFFSFFARWGLDKKEASGRTKGAGIWRRIDGGGGIPTVTGTGGYMFRLSFFFLHPQSAGAIVTFYEQHPSSSTAPPLTTTGARPPTSHQSRPAPPRTDRTREAASSHGCKAQSRERLREGEGEGEREEKGQGGRDGASMRVVLGT